MPEPSKTSFSAAIREEIAECLAQVIEEAVDRAVDERAQAILRETAKIEAVVNAARALCDAVLHDETRYAPNGAVIPWRGDWIRAEKSARQLRAALDAAERGEASNG